MALDVLGILICAAMVLAAAAWVRTIIRGPSAEISRQIEGILQARNIELLEIKSDFPRFRLGRSSRMTWIASGRNVFGTVQNFYFDVDFWAGILSRQPHVRDLGTSRAPWTPLGQ